MPTLKVCLICIGVVGCGFGGAQPVGHQAQLAVAEQLIASGQVTQGYRIMDEVGERQIRSPAVRLDVADSYFKVDALLKAEMLYRDAIAQGAFVKGSVGLGRVSLARNEAAEARKYFQAALEKSDDNASALNGLGVAYDLDGAHAQAQEIYRRILDADPINVDALNNYGLSLVLQGSVQTATRVLTDLTESNLDNPSSRQNLAIAYFLGGQQDAAMRLARLDTSEDDAGQLMAAVAAYRKARS